MKFFQKIQGPDVRAHIRPRKTRRKAAVSQRDLFEIWNHCYSCRVDFKTGKFVASKTGMVSMRSRRPKLILPGCFEGPAAAWAPRRGVLPDPFFRFCLLHQHEHPSWGLQIPYLTTIAIYDAISITEAHSTGPCQPFRFCSLQHSVFAFTATA